MANPGGCTNYHTDFVWDIVGQRGVDTQPVYAMGAGIVHIGARGTGCGHAQSRGDYLYIDHGNGVLSYYGHLGTMFVQDGQYVTARTRIAYVGNTGYNACHTVPTLRYLFLAVKHGGTNGWYAEITHTYACLAGTSTKVSWPTQLGGGWARSRWNLVPNYAAIPATDPARRCIAPTPQTANRPNGVSLYRIGTSIFRSNWAAPVTPYPVYTVVASLGEYHPTIRQWLVLRTHVLSGSARTTAFTALEHNRHYRISVTFGNAAGWSAPSYYVYRGLT